MYGSVILKKFLKIKPKLLCPYVGEEGEIRRSEVPGEEEFLFLYIFFIVYNWNHRSVYFDCCLTIVKACVV